VYLPTEKDSNGLQLSTASHIRLNTVVGVKRFHVEQESEVIPSLRNTDRKVFPKMERSPTNETFSTYSMSRRNLSSKKSRSTTYLGKPVRPGLTHAVVFADRYTEGGNLLEEALVQQTHISLEDIPELRKLIQ